MGKLYLIKPEGARELGEPFEKATTLKRVQYYVGGWVEHVTCFVGGKRCHMFVDEEGLLKNKPVNLIATALYHANSRARLGFEPTLPVDFLDLPDALGVAADCVLHGNPPIVGDVLYYAGSLPSWEPDEHPWKEWLKTT